MRSIGFNECCRVIPLAAAARKGHQRLRASGGGIAPFPALFYTSDVLDACPPPLFHLPAQLWKCHHWKGESRIIRRTLCVCDLGQYDAVYNAYNTPALVVRHDAVAIVTSRAHIELSSSREGGVLKDAFSSGRR